MKKYEQIRQIGKGSFGVVYKCRIRGTGQFVALKLISLYGKPQAELRQLEREIDLLVQTRHPNVIEVLEHFKEGGNLCIVTELAESDLFDMLNRLNMEYVLREPGQLERYVEQLQSVAYQVLSALVYLHGQRMVHRDVKPQNVLVVGGVCKLCDFGFAGQLRDGAEALTSLKGSPIYLAPEIAQQRPYGCAADVWSFGVMMFELATQTPPFVAADRGRLLRLLAEQPPDPPYSQHTVFARFPVLRNFVELCLQRAPERRLTASQLLTHRFVAARPAARLRVAAAAARRDWLAIIRSSVSPAPHHELPPRPRHQPRQRDHKYASRVAGTVQGPMADFPFCDHSEPLRLILAVLGAGTHEFDAQFAAPPVQRCMQKDIRLRIDYEALLARKDTPGSHATRCDKLAFLVYYVTKYERLHFFTLVEELKKMHAQHQNPATKHSLVVLVRTLCVFLGCSVQFQIPIVFSDIVEFPYELMVTYDELRLPMQMEDKLTLSEQIQQTYAFVTSFGSHKPIVDIFRTVQLLICDIAAGRPMPEDSKVDTYLLTTLITALKALFGIQQCLYNKYILFLPSQNRIIQRAVSLDDEVRKSINYDVDMFAIQEGAMPNLGKKQLPDYLKVDEEFLQQCDQGRLFYKTLHNIDDHLKNVREALDSCITNFVNEIPRLSHSVCAYIAHLRQPETVNLPSYEQAVEDQYRYFSTTLLNSMFNGQPISKDAISQKAAEGVRQLFGVVGGAGELDFRFDVTAMRYNLVQVVRCLQMAQQLLLPFQIMEHSAQRAPYYHPFFGLQTIRPSSLLQDPKQVFDEVSLYDQLSEQTFQMYDITAQFRPFIVLLFAMLPFIRFSEVTTFPRSDDTDIIEERSMFMRHYCATSILTITELFCPPIHTLGVFYNSLFDQYPQETSRRQIIEHISTAQSIDHIPQELQQELGLDLGPQIPHRGSYIFTSAKVSSIFSETAFCRNPMQTKFCIQTFTRENVIILTSTYLYSRITLCGYFSGLISQTLLHGILFYDSDTQKIKVKSNELFRQINIHLSVTDEEYGRVQIDFLYQGLYSDNMTEEELDQIQDYIQSNQQRLAVYDLLQVLANNKDFTRVITKLQFQLDCSNEYISYISTLLISSLWIPALQSEECKRLGLIHQIFQLDKENQLVQLIAQDCHTIRKFIQLKQENLKNLFIIDHFMKRLIIFINFVQIDTNSLRERFEIRLNAASELDQQLFCHADKKQDQLGTAKRGETVNIDHSTPNSNHDNNAQDATKSQELDDYDAVMDEYFKYPLFYLSTGTAIRLPIANTIRESEIALQVVGQLTKVLTAICQNTGIIKNIEGEFGTSVMRVVQALMLILDCFVVEHYALQYNEGVLDFLVAFLWALAQRQSMIPGIVQLVNKISIILNLQLNNSLLQAWQSCTAVPHHKVASGKSITQLSCCFDGCKTCFANINGGRQAEDDGYYAYIQTLDAIQTNRNYADVFYHWGKLLSTDGWVMYIGLLRDLVKHFQRHMPQADTPAPLLIHEIVRLVAHTTKASFISQFMFLTSQRRAEETLCQAIELLYHLPNVVYDRQYIMQCYVEANIVQNLIETSYFLHSFATMIKLVSLVSHLCQADQQFTSRIFIHQLANSGMFQVDFFGWIFGDFVAQQREAQCFYSQIFQILSQVASVDVCFAEMIPSLLVQPRVLSIYQNVQCKQTREYILQLCCNLGQYEGECSDFIKPFFELALREVTEYQKVEVKVLVKALAFLSIGIQKDSEQCKIIYDQTALLYQIYHDPSLQQFLPIKGYIINILALLGNHSEEYMLGIGQLKFERMVVDFVTQHEKYSLELQPVVSALILYKSRMQQDNWMRIAMVVKNWNDDDLEGVQQLII